MTVPKLVNFVRSTQKWGTVAQYPHFFMKVLYRIPYFRPEVGEIVRNDKALPNPERSPISFLLNINRLYNRLEPMHLSRRPAL